MSGDLSAAASVVVVCGMISPFEAARIHATVLDGTAFASLILDQMPGVLQLAFAGVSPDASDPAVNFEIPASEEARDRLVRLFERSVAPLAHGDKRLRSDFLVAYASNSCPHSQWECEIDGSVVPTVSLTLDWLDYLGTRNDHVDLDREDCGMRALSLIRKDAPCLIGYNGIHVRNLGHAYLFRYLCTSGGQPPCSQSGRATLADRIAAAGYLQESAHRRDPRLFVTRQLYGNLGDFWRERFCSASRHLSWHPWGRLLRTLPDVRELDRTLAAFHKHMLRADGDRFRAALGTLSAFPVSR